MEDVTISIISMSIFLIGMILLIILPSETPPVEANDNLTGTIVSVRKTEDLTFVTISKEEYTDIILDGDIQLKKGDEVVVYSDDGFATKVIRLSYSDNT